MSGHATRQPNRSTDMANTEQDESLLHLGEALQRLNYRHVTVTPATHARPGATELALRIPDAQVLAVDINDAALRLTRINATLAGARIQAQHSNLLADVDGTFDLIISNPPYMLDPAARAYRNGGGTLGAGLSHAI